MTYSSVRAAWRTNPEGFWLRAAENTVWSKFPETALDRSSPAGRWFIDGELNTCYNALDRHVASGRGDQPALIYDSAMTGTVRSYTYAELLRRVAELAGALRRAGVGTRDRVLIYMPMIPEAVMAMLASARIGAVHSVVFGGFAAPELAQRISDAKPKIVLSASCGLEPGRIVEYKPLLDEACRLATHVPEHRVILQRPECTAELHTGEQDWQAFTKAAPDADCISVRATDPLYILYTSGTTGQPKGIVRDNGGHAVALQWSMSSVYGIGPGDVFWAASDIGWVVGHSYIVYGPLFAGATTVLYEGKPVGTPDASAFWRVLANHKVKVLFTAPTAIRAIKREDPSLSLADGYDLTRFEALFLAGERCDPDTLNWAGDRLEIPVIDHWWQTETGWAIAGHMFGEGPVDARIGSAGRAMPGWDIRVLDDDGNEVEQDDIGGIYCRLPLPPGALSTLWQADRRFHDTYLSPRPGYYQTGDAGFVDEEGYVFVMTRTDDVINVAGHRLSTGALEEVLAMHPDVAECAVTGINDQLKGQVPMGFLCLKAGVDIEESALVDDVIGLVRKHIGPVAAFKRAVVVKRLPKTRSGKILRGTLAKIANGESYEIPATIDDPAILGEIAASLDDAGVIGAK